MIEANFQAPDSVGAPSTAERIVLENHINENIVYNMLVRTLVEGYDVNNQRWVNLLSINCRMFIRRDQEFILLTFENTVLEVSVTFHLSIDQVDKETANAILNCFKTRCQKPLISSTAYYVSPNFVQDFL